MSPTEEIITKYHKWVSFSPVDPRVIFPAPTKHKSSIIRPRKLHLDEDKIAVLIDMEGVFISERYICGRVRRLSVSLWIIHVLFL